jgi:hypothetical protein
LFDALVPDLTADKMCFNDLMREKVVKTTRDSCTRGHAGIQNSYRRLKTVFCWHLMKKMVKQMV